jgi:hypothetical protein
MIKYWILLFCEETEFSEKVITEANELSIPKVIMWRGREREQKPLVHFLSKFIHILYQEMSFSRNAAGSCLINERDISSGHNTHQTD